MNGLGKFEPAQQPVLTDAQINQYLRTVARTDVRDDAVALLESLPVTCGEQVIGKAELYARYRDTQGVLQGDCRRAVRSAIKSMGFMPDRRKHNGVYSTDVWVRRIA